MPGAGFSGAGGSPAGYGTPAFAAIPSKNLFKNSFGPGQLDSRLIDPVTGDFVMGSDGTLMGMTRAQQFVMLAIKTTFGKCCDLNIGNTLGEIQVISSNFQSEVSAKIRSALSYGVDTRMLEIISVTVRRIGSNGAFIVTRWKDLSTNLEQETLIPHG